MKRGWLGKIFLCLKISRTMQKVVVTGAQGQLGRALYESAMQYRGKFEFIFVDKGMLDITQIEDVECFFEKHNPDFVINTAAYTQVDNAEKEQLRAYEINVKGVANLLEVCEKYGTKLVQVSTDYVFDGNSEIPYTEDYASEPINFYGKTKYEAEQIILQSDVTSVILRTSWLYSSFGKNFLKTILDLAKRNRELRIVVDQFGSPTYAQCLADMINMILAHFPKETIVYHYTNKGKTSWFGFAKEIVKIAGIDCEILPIKTSEYKSLARRPQYSVMSTRKIEREFGLKILSWQDALLKCLKKKDK